MKRFCCLLIAIIVFSGLPAVAQDELSSPDQQLLTNSANTAFNQFTFSYTLQFSIDGLDNFDMSAQIMGSGAVDRSAHALSLELNGPILLGTTQHVRVNTDLRLVDNTLYLNPGEDWQSQGDALSFLANKIANLSGLAVEPSALARWDFSGIDGLSQMLTALQQIDAAAYLSARRQPDATMDGVRVASFQFQVDLPSLMQTDGFVDLVGALAAAQGSDLVTYDHQALADIVRANSALFAQSTLRVIYEVGLDNSLVRQIIATLNMPLDPSVLGYADKPLTLHAMLDLKVHDETRPINAPGNATPVDHFSIPEQQGTRTPPGSGTTQYLFFETVGENEVYSREFQARAGDKVTITVRGLGLEFDANATLYDEAGNMLISNDDHEADAFGVNLPDPQIVDYAIPENGYYRVDVAEYEGRPGSFVLTITVRR